MSTTKRRKYEFRSREEAEAAFRAAEAVARRHYQLAALLFHNVAPREFRRGDWIIRVWTHHATSGRELAAGPIAIVQDTTATPYMPDVVDAFKWASDNANRFISMQCQSDYDLRDVATDVLRFLNTPR